MVCILYLTVAEHPSELYLLGMRPYTPRIVDAELDELQASLPAIALEGPKGVGKTATGERRAASVFRLDDPAQRSIVEADVTLPLGSAPPVLIDEWQRVPAVWDAVRRAVDDGAPGGQYILAGSALPDDTREEAKTHSGAGRIVSVRMRPLALAERGLGQPTVSMRDLLTGTRPRISGVTEIHLEDYAREVVRSGFPGLRQLQGRALRAQLDGYLTHIVDRDFVEAGHAVRKPDALRRWMAAYAAATATATTLEKIRDGATSGDGVTSTRKTTLEYRDVLERLWILDPVPGWLPSRNHLERLTQAPRHHLADPALAARLLGADEGALLSGMVSPLFVPEASTGKVPATAPRDGTLFGQLFESLVTQSVRVYAQAHEAVVRHLRLYDGRHEVDLIVERPDHRVLAIEVKLSAAINDHDVEHLTWLQEKMGADLLDALVISSGPQAYRRQDGIAVVPAALLGP